MDPKRYPDTLLAPGHLGAPALRLPGVHDPSSPGPRFPRVDDHLVEPETRQEMVRGERMEAMPANPPHGDRHSELDYVIRGNVARGYIPSADLLTRVGPRSNFATDVSVRREGIDPDTGARYLEELAFEVVSEQSLRHITIRAEDLAERGVRRIIAVFVKRGEVAEWSQTERRFVPLPLDGLLEDPTLLQSIPVRALLDAATADNAVAAALHAKGNPWLLEREAMVRAEGRQEGREEGREEGRKEALRASIESLCVTLELPIAPSERERLQSLDSEQLGALLRLITVERRWPEP